ncbi:MAG TPA: hypothetical protein VM537_23985 [Anaerolineae bacterium]|nr:hypothetical protein [Anaerolineae bacterium]
MADLTHIKTHMVQPNPSNLPQASWKTPSYPADLTPQGWDDWRAEISGRPVTQHCPRCKGVGWLIRNEDMLLSPGARAKEVLMSCPTCGTEGRRHWIRRHCGMEVAEQARRLSYWKMPAFPDADKRKQRDTAATAIRQAVHDRTGLYTFWGDYGSGKTLALQIVLNEQREGGQALDGYYAPFAIILDHLRSLFNQREQTSTYWDRLLSVPVLAVDEVTRFNATSDWQRDMLFVLVDTRYRRRASHLTLFATNDDPRKALPTSDSLGYLFSRMREGALLELRGDVRNAKEA